MRLQANRDVHIFGEFFLRGPYTAIRSMDTLQITSMMSAEMVSFRARKTDNSGSLGTEVLQLNWDSSGNNAEMVAGDGMGIVLQGTAFEFVAPDGSDARLKLDSTATSGGKVCTLSSDRLNQELDVTVDGTLVLVLSKSEGVKAQLPVFFQLDNGINVETLTADKTLSVTADAMFQKLYPLNSKKTVKLPVASTDIAGLMYRIINSNPGGAPYQDLDVKELFGSAWITLNPLEAMWVICDGSNWQHAGVETIALS